MCEILADAQENPENLEILEPSWRVAMCEAEMLLGCTLSSVPSRYISRMIHFSMDFVLFLFRSLNTTLGKTTLASTAPGE